MPNTAAHTTTAPVSLTKHARINTRKAWVHTCTRMVTAGVPAPINYSKAARGTAR